jgi:hypothetical protein
MIFDTSEKGLLTLFKPYQAALLEHIWELNNPERTGVTSGQAYEFLGARESYIEFPNSSLVGVSIETNSIYLRWNDHRSFYGCGGCVSFHITECGETTDGRVISEVV